MSGYISEEIKGALILNIPVYFKIFKENEKEIDMVCGKTECLARDGMLFTANRYFTLNQILHIELNLKETEQKIFAVIKIKQVEINAEGKVRMGADFEEISDSDRMLLNEYILKNG